MEIIVEKIFEEQYLIKAFSLQNKYIDFDHFS